VRGDRLGPGVAAGAGAAEQIICAFPRLRQPLDIPIPGSLVGADAAAGGADVASGKGADVAGGADVDDGSDELALHVWLHSPLGPAVATIAAEQLRRSAEAGGAPLVVIATPQQEGAPAEPGDGPGMASTDRERLEVGLQFKAEHHALPAYQRRQNSLLAANRSSSMSRGGASPSADAGSIASLSSLPAILAVLSVPLLAAWLQLVLRSDGSSATVASVLTSVAFLISSLAALVAIVVMQLKGRPLPPPAEQVSNLRGARVHGQLAGWMVMLRGTNQSPDQHQWPLAWFPTH